MKILVVGAGIAGPAICYWLKHYGFEPTLIEQQSSLRGGGYAIDIRGICVDVVRQMGIYETICKNRTQVASGKYVDEDGKTLHEDDGETLGFREGDDVEINRGLLGQILMEAISDHPCHYGTTLQAIEQNDHQVIAEFNDGQKESFDLIIGADGLHSKTRKLAFGDSPLTNLGYYIAVYEIPNYLNLSHSEILFEKDEKLMHVVSDHDPQRAHVGLMFKSNEALNNILDAKEQRQFLVNHFKDLGWEANTLLSYLDNADPLYFDAISQVRIPKWHQGRVVLAGDAGYCSSPLSGQGTSLALVGSYILAGELHKNRDNIDNALSRYNELMRPFVEPNQHFGEWVSETFLRADLESKERAEQRNAEIMERLNQIKRAITLPHYD